MGTPIKQSFKLMLYGLRKFASEGKQTQKNINKKLKNADRKYQLKNYDLYAVKSPTGKGLQLAEKSNERSLGVRDLIDTENRLTHPLWGKIKPIKKKIKPRTTQEKMEAATRKLREIQRGQRFLYSRHH